MERDIFEAVNIWLDQKRRTPPLGMFSEKFTVCGQRWHYEICRELREDFQTILIIMETAHAAEILDQKTFELEYHELIRMENAIKYPKRGNVFHLFSNNSTRSLLYSWLIHQP